jgi:hypothetical protein
MAAIAGFVPRGKDHLAATIDCQSGQHRTCERGEPAAVMSQ